MLHASIPPFLICTALNSLSNPQAKFRQLGQRDILAGIQRAKYLGHGHADLIHEFPPPTMQQPPAKREIATIGLKVIAESLGEIVIIVLETDGSGIGGRGG